MGRPCTVRARSGKSLRSASTFERCRRRATGVPAVIAMPRSPSTSTVRASSGPPLVDDAPVDQEVHHVGHQLLEQPLVVGDGQHAELGLLSRTACTPRPTTRRASMSRPESVSSSTATSGSSSAICRISLRFFSPPQKPWLRWRLAKEGSMPRRSIHSVMSTADLEHRDLGVLCAPPWPGAGTG